MASNKAVWMTAAYPEPFEVKAAPLVAPRENQILVKNRAIAINPLDGGLQQTSLFQIFQLNYPTIFGMDVAGEVVQVGPGVTGFKSGDRVMGHAVGLATKQESEKGFQAYTILNTNMCCRIPVDMSFNHATVLPLGISTVAAALFLDEHLGLQLPTEPAQTPTGKSLLVWAGASSMGSCAIQLAVAAGYEVVTTASEKNFDYVKKLGASHVVDYHSPTVVSELLDIFNGKTCVGALDCVGGAAWAPAIEFVQKTDGVKTLITLLNEYPEVQGITLKQSHAPMILGDPVSQAVWVDFVPKALESGSLVPAPEPLVAGHGLESIQSAVNLQRQGTSARKVIVTL